MIAYQYEYEEYVHFDAAEEVALEQIARADLHGSWYSSNVHGIIGYEPTQPSKSVKSNQWAEADVQVKLFQQLAEDWRRDTLAMSFIQHIAMHPAYQRIIGMGLSAVPLILRELEAHSDPWFWALEAITGLQPALDVQPGNYAMRAEHWVNWGRVQGYI